MDGQGSTLGTIAQVGIPLAAGVAAAASPAGARGLYGLTQTLGTMTAVRDEQRKRKAQEQLATRLGDVLSSTVRPEVPGESPEQQFAKAAERSPELNFTGQSPTEMGFPGRPRTPEVRLRDVMGPAQAGIVESLVSSPETAAQAIPFLSAVMKPKEWQLAPGGQVTREDYPGGPTHVVASAPEKPNVKPVTVYENGRSTIKAIDFTKVAPGTVIGEPPPNPAEWSITDLDTPQGVQKAWVKKGTTERVPFGFAPESGIYVTEPGPSGPENVLRGTRTGQEKARSPHYEKPDKSLDALIARANDPNVPEADRVLAKTQAEAIQAGRVDVARQGAEARLQAQEKEYTPEAIAGMVAYARSTGTIPPLGFSPAGRGRFYTALNESYKNQGGMGAFAGDQALLKAMRVGLDGLEKQRATIEAFMKTNDKNLELAEALSDAVSRSDIPAINRLLMPFGRTVQGRADIAGLDAAVLIARSETARVLTSATGAGVLSDTARAEVDKVFHSGQGPQQIKAVVGIFRRDMDNRVKSYDEQRTQILQTIRGVGGATEKAPDAGGVGAEKMSKAAPIVQGLQTGKVSRAQARAQLVRDAGFRADEADGFLDTIMGASGGRH